MTPEGTVSAGWEPVRDAFVENFRSRGELGAAVAVVHRGEVVVDLWAGTADARSGRRWTEHTPGIVFSATKGLVATCFLLLADRGQVDLDAPVSESWPELRGHGKERITVRQLLCHRSGLSAIDRPLTLRDVRDAPDRVHDALVSQVPLWEPDTDQGYGACSWGLYTAELFRRLTGRTLGAFLASEIAGPTGLELALGRPDALATPATLVPPSPRHQLPELLRRTNEGRVFRRVIRRDTDTGRAFRNPTMGRARFEALNEPELQAIELPWMNAHATARGLARLYGALATDGTLDGVRLVRASSLRPIHGRQSWTTRDRVLRKPIGWSSGFVKDEPHLFSSSPRAFGHPGAGGSLGWADPDVELGIGYVANRMDHRIRSPRAIALCHAARSVVTGRE